MKTRAQPGNHEPPGPPNGAQRSSSARGGGAILTGFRIFFVIPVENTCPLTRNLQVPRPHQPRPPGLADKLGFRTTLDTRLPTDRATFHRALSQTVLDSDLGFFADFQGLFAGGDQDFLGYVRLNTFKIKQRRRFFDPNYTFAVAEGSFTEEGDKLRVRVTIDGLSTSIKVGSAVVLVFYAFFLTVFFGVAELPTFALPFVLLHGCLMLAIPYFLARRSVKQMRRHLEREFHYLVSRAA